MPLYTVFSSCFSISYSWPFPCPVFWVHYTLNAPYLNPEDIVVIYLSCHGSVYGRGHTFCLLPSDAKLEVNGFPKKTTVIDIHDLAKTLSGTSGQSSWIWTGMR